MIGNKNLFQTARIKSALKHKKKENREKEYSVLNSDCLTNSENDYNNKQDHEEKWLKPRSTFRTKNENETSPRYKMLNSKSCLKQFEAKNRFDCLRFITDQTTQLKKEEVLKMPKSQLKRCRKCHFKKRTCLLDFDSCKAIAKFCYRCSKAGHYPQSLNCQANRVTRRAKQSTNLIHSNYEDCYYDSEQFRTDILLLVTKRIKQLQNFDQQHYSTKISDKHTHEDQTKIIPDNLVPFRSITAQLKMLLLSMG